ncbi:choice-of-anchor Q domain-containing protein [Parasedimentitalea psychrophila]|uniref:Choice-of-anchor Q domain-containing protein n=1 Tax=Parasedimentitalea psychrophila TaxID=2997337 RepID=A0A9Y2KZV0_9RHOB|nr:choice-of-anchor Q domain-containing protein [Parasedimentitalea psychrophila]WIY24787.1 choice-of-anchor Q domain-containing protein [Parasedimentitalea psychrophila]
MAMFRVEAESLNIIDGFKVETLAAASGGQTLKAESKAPESRAQFTFTGEDGIYDLDIGHFDENDGSATLTVLVNGIEVGSFVLDQELGSHLANQQTHTVRRIENVALQDGDTFEILGMRDGGEPVRMDYIDFTLTGPGTDVIEVDTPLDVTDASDGLTSLREAIAMANADPDANTITFNTDVFNDEPQDVIRLTQGALLITSDLTIDGDLNDDGQPDIIVSGDVLGDDVTTTDPFGKTITNAPANPFDSDNSYSVFSFRDSSEATLDGLVVTGAGSPGDEGSAIVVGYGANLTVRNSSLSGNTSNTWGAALYNSGTTILEDTAVAFNVAGAMFNEGLLTLSTVTATDNSSQALFNYGSLEIFDSRFAGNTSGLTNFNGGTATIQSSDFTNHIRGAIYNDGTLNMTGGSILNNTNTASGAGLRNNGGTATLDGVVISGNVAPGGGGIWNEGTLTLTNALMSENRASGEDGGAVLNDGTLILSNSMLTENSASESGGGIANRGMLTLSDSTITGSLAEGGAAITNDPGATADITNVTIAGNYVAVNSGAVSNSGDMTILNSTVTGNTSVADYNAGVFNIGTLQIGNSIVLGNTPGETYGVMTETGPNIIGGLDPADVFVAIDPVTGGGLLADNGGPTETVAILAGGPAAGAANPATATPADQRGVPRDVAPDLGAFEAQQGPPPEPFRIEAEDLTRDVAFKVKNLASASANQVLQADGSAEQRASYVFDRPAGTYSLTIGYFDENDGVSSFAVFVDGVEIGNWLWDEELGSAFADNMTATTHTIQGVNISQGEVIEFVGMKDAGEPLRFDYVDFAPTGQVTDTTPPQVDTASAPGIGNAQQGDATTQVTVTYSDNVALDVSSFDTEDIRVTGPGGIDVDVTGFSVDTPSDGTPRTVTYTIAAPGGTWDPADNGIYSVSLDVLEVFDTAFNEAEGIVDLAAFTVAIDDQPPPASFRKEAEDFDILTSYTAKSLSAASGDAVLQAVGSGEKRASFAFDQPTGNYDLKIGYFDENDGEASFRLLVDGVEIDSFVWNQDLGSPLANATTATTRDLLGISLQNGSVIEVIGQKDGSEPARFDYVDFIGLPVGTPDNNVVVGTPEVENINAGIGNDTLSGGSGNDILAGGPGNDILVGGPSNPTLGLNFTGTLTSQLPFRPPDTMGAVGNDHIVEMLNGRFAVYDQTSGNIIQAQSTDQFWRDAGVTLLDSAVDPRILYDPIAERWIATAFQRTTNLYLLAASLSADPTDGWAGFSLASAEYAGIDLPTLGFNADIVVVNTSNEMLTIPKEDLYNGNFESAQFLLAEPDPGRGKYQPIVDLDNSGMPFPIFSFNWIAGNSVQVATVNGTATSPSINVQVPDSVIFDQIYGPPPNAQQPGTNVHLETIDNRFLTNLILQEGSVWGVHHVEENGRAALHWFQIDAETNTLLNDGLIPDAELDLYFGSIAVNDYGNVVIGYNGSSGSQFVSSYAVTAKLAQDGSITFDEPVLLKAGVAPYVGAGGFDPDTTRWGDYSATVLDPDDPYTFWTFQEVVVSENVGATQITEIDLLGRGVPDNDQLSGGPGNDTLSGGNGLDVFLFNTTDISSANAEPDLDQILDFQISADRIEFIDDANVGLSGAVAAGNQTEFLDLGDSFGPLGNPGDIFLTMDGADTQIVADYDNSGSLSSLDQVVIVDDVDPLKLLADIFVFV